MKIIKVDQSQVLNEDGYSYGFANGPMNHQGFSYEQKALSTNLSQGGNDSYPSTKNKSYKFFAGDNVVGIGIKDGKEYTGIIKYVRWAKDSIKPICVYVQSYDNNDTIPLKPESIRKTKIQMPLNKCDDYLMSHAFQIDHDFGRFSPVGSTLEQKVIQGIRNAIKHVLNELKEYN